MVCSSKLAAVRYKKFIDEALAERLAIEEAKLVFPGGFSYTTLPKPDRQLVQSADTATSFVAEGSEIDRQQYRDDDLCRKLAFLKSAVVVSSEGTNERAIITQARKHATECKAVENFKKSFDYSDPEKSNTGMAFLVVCDMLLTGFDATD